MERSGTRGRACSNLFAYCSYRPAIVAQLLGRSRSAGGAEPAASGGKAGQPRRAPPKACSQRQLQQMKQTGAWTSVSAASEVPNCDGEALVTDDRWTAVHLLVREPVRRVGPHGRNRAPPAMRRATCSRFVALPHMTELWPNCRTSPTAPARAIASSELRRTPRCGPRVQRGGEAAQQDSPPHRVTSAAYASVRRFK